MFLVVINRRYNFKWFEPLVLKLGDTLELPGEYEDILETGYHLQRSKFNRMQTGN